MKRAEERRAAKEYVLEALRREVAGRQAIAKGWGDSIGRPGDAYRREILRLWRAALRGAQVAAKR